LWAGLPGCFLFCHPITSRIDTSALIWPLPAMVAMVAG
jgi:hypothetical protein